MTSFSIKRRTKEAHLLSIFQFAHIGPDENKLNTFSSVSSKTHLVTKEEGKKHVL